MSYRRRRGVLFGSGVPKLAAGASVSLLGDSMFARAANFTTGVARTTAENRQSSELAWAMFKQPNFIHRNWWDATATAANRVPTYGASMASDTLFSGLNFGYSGDTATGALLRVPQVISSGTDVSVVNVGTNVGTTDGTAADTITSIQSIVEDLVAGGVRVVLGTIRPRRVDDTSPQAPDISTAQMQRIVDINASIRANWRTWGASALWDPWEDLRDPQYNPGDALYGTILPAYAIADGIHLSSRGAEVGSRTLRLALNRVISAGYWFNTDMSVSNIVLNGALANAAGTVGAGITGTVPTSWTLANAQGAGQPVTAVAAAANGELTITITSAAGGTADTFNTIRFSPSSAPTTGFTSTDYVVAGFEIEIVDPDAILVMGQATLGQTSTISARGLGQASSAYNTEPSPFRDNALAGWVFTEPLLAESRTNLNPRMDFSVRVDLAGTAVVKIKSAFLRTISSPETDFPWVP
jgi:lysophospholipase L1-like esterase